MFNFSAARATRKKSAAMINARASCLRDIDLDVAPITFLRDTTDRHELSRYVFEDLLSCPVGSRIIMSIQSGVEGDPTETSIVYAAYNNGIIKDEIFSEKNYKKNEFSFQLYLYTNEEGSLSTAKACQYCSEEFGTIIRQCAMMQCTHKPSCART